MPNIKFSGYLDQPSTIGNETKIIFIGHKIQIELIYFIKIRLSA